jgi:acetyl-CoA carboxylase biotin carboxylase subunit
MFESILIANRGEIALRVVRACRELGIRSIAVHSTEDSDSAAVRAADQAVHIGPAPAARSYLHIPSVVEAARLSGAQAVHPGYGFLSENPVFAEVCAAEGLTFIGASASVLTTLGNKAAARALMRGAHLPILPGSEDVLTDADAAARAAAEVGYPVIIKAVAGGGGRGMTVVRDPAELPEAHRTTRASAQVLFGDPDVYLERYLDAPRHVEIQILSDSHGNTVHLGERDCSVQRRHQKLVEESPAPGLPRELVESMQQAALRGALAAGYVGVGTFEFLVDDRGGHWFMEVNPRIQVEHPVTELVTGIDLVREQILVASGAELPFRQQDVVPRGYAMECRINAENPDLGFAPTAGIVTRFVPPSGPFVRVDTHLCSGDRISPCYDSLAAKVLVWAPDRETGIARMRSALAEFDIQSPVVHTTREFLDEVLRHPDFRAARHSTRLVEEMTTSLV